GDARQGDRVVDLTDRSAEAAAHDQSPYADVHPYLTAEHLDHPREGEGRSLFGFLSRAQLSEACAKRDHPLRLLLGQRLGRVAERTTHVHGAHKRSWP